MNVEEWARLRAEFEFVEQLSAEDRERRLTEVERTSPNLAFELRRLLAAADSAGYRVLDISIPERLSVLAPGLDDAPVPSRDLAGEVLTSRYRIESLLGSGGSSDVWLARDECLSGRKVVVKVPHSAMSGEGFQLEVDALAGVHHPGVAHPLDSGTMDDGTFFLVLEWVDGRSLREMLRCEGRLDREVALQVIAGVAEALDAVHQAGVLHMDVKPENVMVQRSDRGLRAVLVDFGIARSQAQAQAGAEAGLRGSPRYMAPERFAGVESPAADVYGLGVLALEMLSGQTGMAGAAKLRPKALREALSTALDSDPRARPASAGELASRLRRAIGVWRRQVAGIAIGLTLVATLLGYQEYQRRSAREAQARQHRESVSRSKEFAEAIGFLDSLTGAKQGRQFVGLWRFVDSESSDPQKLEAASEILIAAGMQYGHPGHRHMGQSGNAETTLLEAQRLADKAMALAPARWQGRKVAGQSRDALGSVLIEMGRYQEAEQVLLDGLRVSDAEPQLAGIHAGLLGSLSRIAFHNRDLQRCLRLRNELVDVRRQLWSANPAGIGFWNDYAGALAARGYVLREMGDYVAALRDYAESDRILELGSAISPGDRQPAWLLARNSLEVGRTLCLAGDVKGACRRLANASEELREFKRDDTSDQATVRELALSLAWLGKARKQAGSAGKDWRTPVEEAVRLATAAAQHDPASAKAAENLAAIQSIASDLGVARGTPGTRSELAARP